MRRTKEMILTLLAAFALVGWIWVNCYLWEAVTHSMWGLVPTVLTTVILPGLGQAIYRDMKDR